jgi:hypothetical protein
MISLLRLTRATRLFACLAMISGCAGSGTGASADPSEIEALERQMWDYWKNREFDSMRVRLSEDAVLVGAEGVMNRDDAIAFMAKQKCDVQQVELEGVRVTSVAPTVALITYRATGTGTCDGQPLGTGTNSSIWVQRDGTWQTVHHQQSNAQTEQIAGNWELNLSKSKFVPADGAPKSQSRVYQVLGQQETGRHTGVDAQGNPTLIEFTVGYDGKDYPYKGPDFDTLAIRRVDANTTSFTQSRSGKMALTGTRVVSPDGKTLTITAKGTNAKGQTIDSVMVFDRR